jgi:uncharacterized protein (DUF427 family)
MRPPQPDPIGPGQESVWDYPRPPRLEATPAKIEIVFAGTLIASTTAAYRVLETSHPPAFYLPPGDINATYVQPSEGAGSSFCEWKGMATYYSVRVGDSVLNRVGWAYPTPTANFAPIANYLSFYAGPMDACFVDGEQVVPQPGGFYGGWITRNIVGPFKGIPGSMGW